MKSSEVAGHLNLEVESSGARTSVFTKHNWDQGTRHLWLNGGLNGWGIYGLMEDLMGGAFMA